jgi:outer membrane protein TolC
LGYGIANLPTDNFKFNQWNMTMKQLTLSQRFPFPGKLRLQAEVAAREAEIAREDLQELENRIVNEVKRAFYDIYFIDEAIAVTERNKTLLAEFVKIADTKYRVGTGIQQDVLLAQVELSKIMDELIRLEQQRRTAAVRLNTLLDLPPESPVGKTRGVARVPVALDLEALKETALQRRPLLRALEREIARREEAYRLAKLQYYPDFTLSFAYGQREGASLGRGRADFVSASATINIPLYFRTKQDEGVNEARAEVRRAKRRYETQKNEVFFALGDLVARLRRDLDRLKLFAEAIIPQARQSLDSAISGYQVNKVDFLTLLGNQVTLFNFERDYYQVLADYQQTLAELEQAVGQRFY